jgi:hypothetical protein
VENRTRTYQPRQSRSFDDQFDCQLPEEARAELVKQAQGKKPPPPPSRKVVYRPPPPAKRSIGTAIIGTIAIVALLYAVSRPSSPMVPAESRSVPAPSLPASVEVRRALPVEVRQALPVEVRRALPAVPRALLVSRLRENVPTPAESQWLRMPDGTTVEARYQGELSSSAALPPQGRFIGEEWSTGNTSWIWMTPDGASFPSWVDP